MKNPISIPRRTASALRSRLPRRPDPRPERASRLPAHAELGGPLHAFRAAALWGIAVLVATADGAAFSESYRGLLDWAREHGLSGFWAAAFPLQVDLFIAVGELVLFIAMADRWRWRDRLSAWAVAGLGLAVSVAGNIGHVHAHDLQTRGTAAVPPVAAFGALWLGLGVLKRILRARPAGTARDVQAAAAEAPEAGQLAEVLAAIRELPGRLPATGNPEVPADARQAALIAMKASIAARNPLPRRQIEVRYGLTRTEAARVIELAELNGSGAHA